MKKTNEQTDLSSSEDEESVNILKEAIDQQFLTDDLYNVEKAKVIPSAKTEQKSLRANSKQEAKFTNFGVTPTFQSFIAKKLDEILERSIKLEHVNCFDKQKQKTDKSPGIKLLSTSKKSLSTKVKEEVNENYMEHVKKLKRNKEAAEDNEDALSRFREVAVEPEHILSKADTEAWINKRPTPEFKYKRLKNGTLIEI